MEKPPVSWEILFESWKHEVELSFIFFFTGFYFQHLWRLGRAAILSDTQCLRNTRSSCMCVRVARCSHDLFSKFVCPKFRIWFLLYSVNLSVKWHLGKGEKKRMCRMMNRSCLPIKVEQVKRSRVYWLGRYFPLENLPRDFENGHFPVSY
jgi:hypothetical protein